MDNIEKQPDDYRLTILNDLTNKSAIEKIIFSENKLDNDERRKNLGVESERILFKYTMDELDLAKTYKLIKLNMVDRRVIKALINGVLSKEIIINIVKIAAKQKVPYTIIRDPDFRGNIGLGLLGK